MCFLKRIAAIFLLLTFSAFASSPEIETTLSLFAKEESYIYVLDAKDNKRIQSGILKKGETYKLPHDGYIKLSYEGNIVAVVDGYNYFLNEIGLYLHDKTPHRQILLNYEDIKENIASQQIRLLAKEHSYIYVFKADSNTALRVGELVEKESYLLPNNTEARLTFVGNVVAVIDNQYEIPLDSQSNKKILLNYKELKQQIEK